MFWWSNIYYGVIFCYIMNLYHYIKAWKGISTKCFPSLIVKHQKDALYSLKQELNAVKNVTILNWFDITEANNGFSGFCKKSHKKYSIKLMSNDIDQSLNRIT